MIGKPIPVGLVILFPNSRNSPFPKRTTYFSFYGSGLHSDIIDPTARRFVGLMPANASGTRSDSIPSPLASYILVQISAGAEDLHASYVLANNQGITRHTAPENTSHKEKNTHTSHRFSQNSFKQR